MIWSNLKNSLKTELILKNFIHFVNHMIYGAWIISLSRCVIFIFFRYSLWILLLATNQTKQICYILEFLMKPIMNARESFMLLVFYHTFMQSIFIYFVIILLLLLIFLEDFNLMLSIVIDWKEKSQNNWKHKNEPSNLWQNINHWESHSFSLHTFINKHKIPIFNHFRIMILT